MKQYVRIIMMVFEAFEIVAPQTPTVNALPIQTF